MARLFKEFYTPEVLKAKEAFYTGLGEKARRHFLGQEYSELGVGSQRYLSRVFGCSRNTVLKGYKEVNSPSFSPDYTSQRSAGAGRKKRRGLSLSDSSSS